MINERGPLSRWVSEKKPGVGLFWSLWQDDSSNEGLVYDPVHVAAVLVGCLVVIGVLFWDLWALLVFRGGLFSKVVPFCQVLFTSKTWGDFAGEGALDGRSVFEGWGVHLAALVCAVGFIVGIVEILKTQRRIVHDR